MVRVAITGVGGKMGSTILRLALADREIEVTGATEVKNHPFIGKKISEVAGSTDNTTVIVDDLSKAISLCDVVIDFTSPSSSLAHFRLAQSSKKAIVIGTTGFPDAVLTEIQSAKDVKVVISPNMSVGVNLMFDIVERIAKILKDDYDIEITEMHHRWKKDAPSGTAIKLKDLIKGAQPEKRWVEIFGRQGITGERKNEEIGILSLRGGDVVGEHTVTFAGIGERLEVTHRASTRENFARGALVAAKWIVSQKEGFYSMKNVLGL